MVSDNGENWLTRRFNVNDIIIRKKTFGGEKSLRQNNQKIPIFLSGIGELLNKEG